ncbi:MAG: glycosyltransferase family 2 protein [Gallionella sp.]
MNQRPAPYISVIVAVYNGVATLQQCIDSVAAQTYPNKELIVIDGGSSDGTVQLLEQNRLKFSYWRSEPDRGIFNAWNKGLDHATGEWMCFLGADDFLWDNTVIERMADQLVLLPVHIRVAYAQIMLIELGNRPARPKGEPWPTLKAYFKECMCIPHVGTMHRRSLFERHGKFDESFRIAGDYELLLRELTTGDAAFLADITVAAQRLGGVSTSHASYLRTLRETRRAQKMHGQRWPGKQWLKDISKEYFRLVLWAVIGEASARKLLDIRRRLKGLPPFWTQN